MAACLPPVLIAPPLGDVPSCRGCGCTDAYACIVQVRGINRACRWVAEDLCSACSGDETLIARGPASGLSPLALGNGVL